ncbi:hypothetical protein DVH24_001761 [Malus domestica]|uniref:Uncharacterized protein n=1 Tax=Malus domestica TaxID=3750 RepID=A0A498IAT1_MALDO|nr:hypothetical protein DVH24_001761 [Malus domestica]
MVIIREQSPIRRFLIVHNKILRPPKHRMQPNQNDPNHPRNDDVDPHVSQDQSHNRHHRKNNHHDSVRDHKPEHLEGLVTGEVEHEPGGEDDQEDDDGEWVVEEAEEEHDQGDQGVVGAEVGQVLGESGRRVR